MLANNSGSNNICIGNLSNVGANNLTNAIVIGANAVVSQSNSLILGNNTKVGIGTSSPSSFLSVIATDNSNPLATLSQYGSAPALKVAASSGVGLELENGSIKVSGTNRTAFQHIATAGNILTNGTTIPNTTMANSATDLLIVTPYWDGVYMNTPIGVYFTAGSWVIFRQDQLAMPVNAKFNVLVIKQ
jgi:hypothetical protein